MNLHKLAEFMTAEERNAQLRRILIIEKYVMLPVKFGVILLSFLLLHSMKSNPNLDERLLRLELILYALGNLVFLYIIIKIGQKKLHLQVVQISAFFLSIIDNLFLCCLIYFTGGLESPLYWAYIWLMIRNAINFPKIGEQGVVNGAFCLFYIGAVLISERETDIFFQELFILKVLILMLVGVCCWGIGILFRREVRKYQETFEKTVRSGRLFAAGQLAGQIAHGLKNPLSIINNASYYLQKHIKSDNVNISDQLRIIREEVDRSNKIMTDLVNYSKLIKTQIDTVNVNAVIESVTKEFRPESTMKNITLSCELGKNIPFLFIDEGQLKQLVTNLLLNSIEVLDGVDGQIMILTKYTDDGMIQIVFEDNGPGLSSESVKKVFIPFYSTKKGGTGLGMSIVKNIVDSYDGIISLKNKKNKGLIITIQFPTRSVNR